MTGDYFRLDSQGRPLQHLNWDLKMRGEVIFKQKEQQRQGPRVKSSTAHILCSHSSHKGEITPSAMQRSHPDKNHLPNQGIFPAHIYLREMQG